MVMVGLIFMEKKARARMHGADGFMVRLMVFVADTVLL
jgi:hypothetical protein